MAQIDLGYGRGSLVMTYDEQRFSVLAAPARDDQQPLSDALIGEAIDAPIESPPFDEIVSPGDTVLIVVSDATRESGSAQIVNLLVRRLIELGVLSSAIKIIFATGIHRPVTADEKKRLLTPFIAQRIITLEHDAYDRTKLVSLAGMTGAAAVEVNRALLDHTHVFLTGAVNFHYFAGFTGGRKSVCPGLASASTIEATHMLALDFVRGGRREGVGAGILDGNRVHEECDRVAEMVAPSFLINAAVDERGRVVRAYAGNWRAAHRRACTEYAADHSLKIDARRDVVVASCGGTPYDINLIQAHKALDMAAHACSEGGTIILVAECPDGFGRADFLKWFQVENARALEDELREHYEVNGQTAWSILVKAERFRVYLVSGLDDSAVERMRMTPARTVDVALAETSSEAEGYIMPHAATLLPVTGSATGTAGVSPAASPVRGNQV